jgi:hypothetical protein
MIINGISASTCEKCALSLWTHSCNEPPDPGPTVGELCVVFLEHAQSHSTKAGKATSEICILKSGMRPLNDLYGRTPVTAQMESCDVRRPRHRGGCTWDGETVLNLLILQFWLLFPRRLHSSHLCRITKSSSSDPLLKFLASHTTKPHTNLFQCALVKESRKG